MGQFNNISDAAKVTKFESKFFIIPMKNINTLVKYFNIDQTYFNIDQTISRCQ